MENTVTIDDDVDRRLARRLKALRGERNWPLDELARKSGVSRATLSRLENAEVSPTTAVLGKLCAAFGLTLSRLLNSVEQSFAPLVRRDQQAIWQDARAGFSRRAISPPAQTLAGEGLDCTLDAGTRITYDAPPRPGLEHHLYLLDGVLTVTLDDTAHDLRQGDCLRYQLFGASAFETPAGRGARYVLFTV